MDLLFTRASVKRFFYLLLVAAIALMAHAQCESPERSWLLWSALLFGCISLGVTCWQQIKVIVLLGIATALLVLLAGYFAFSIYLLAAYVFVVTLVSALLLQRYPYYFLALVLMNALVLLAALLPPHASHYDDRFLFILAGCLIAAIPYALLCPSFMRAQLQLAIIDVLQQIRQLNHEIFSCYLEEDYPLDVYLYEHRLHAAKNKLLQAIANLYALTGAMKVSPQEKKILKLAQKQINTLYAIMLDFAQLRFRVADHTTFAICREELVRLAEEMENAFAATLAMFRRQKNAGTRLVLAEKIKWLEENYQSVVQVAAREPLAFLLFIHSLNNFSEHWEQFDALLQDLRDTARL